MFLKWSVPAGNEDVEYKSIKDPSLIVDFRIMFDSLEEMCTVDHLAFWGVYSPKGDFTINCSSAASVQNKWWVKQSVRHMRWGWWWWWWWWTQRGKRNGVVLVRWGGGEGGTDVVPHLHCSAGLFHPIVSQLSVRGAGPEADDSQGEFSVRRGEGGRECVRERKSERGSRWVCSGALRSRTQPQCSACSRILRISRLSISSLTLLCLVLLPLLSRLFLLFAGPFRYNLGFSVSSTDCFTLLLSPFIPLPLLSL